MQDQALIDAMDRFYKHSYPEPSSASSMPDLLPSLETQTLPDSNKTVNLIVKTLCVVGLFYVGYRLVNEFKRNRKINVRGCE
jgi:hypothetical protein